MAIALAAAWAVGRLVPRPRLALLGLAVVVVAALLAGVVPAGAIGVPIGLVAGSGLALASPSLLRTRADTLVGFALVGLIAIVLRVLVGEQWALLAVVAGVAIAAGVSLASRINPRPVLDRAAKGTVTLATGLALLLVLWVGCNDPALGWLGPVTSHGPRDQPTVALTFDDGPDGTYTSAVRDILDRAGVKGTFFTVGKALVARSDITRALIDDGHLVGNHSYRHDYWGWLNPAYPELDETQKAFGGTLGVCPAFYRPPHGQRTPITAWRVNGKGMTTVTWDVSASDWVERDGAVVAKRILDQVRPGSIILLHDALDGKLQADRSVLLTALPLILDGLKAKGLTPVRLDQLLGVPGYLPAADCA